MIIDIIQDESIKPSDKVLFTLFEVGYATKPQLGKLLGWDNYKVTNAIHYIRKHHENNGKGPKWIDLQYVPTNTSGKPKGAYSLTKYGIGQIKELRGDDSNNLKTPKPIQMNHYLGITNILSRLLGVLDQKHWKKCEWWSEHESRQYVVKQYYQKIKSVAPNTKLSPSQLMKILSPDAYLRIMRQPFWIEFDNNTERAKKLEDRFMRYIKTFYPRVKGYSLIVKQIEFPVVWVTKNEHRRRYMERKWEEVRDRCMKDVKNQRTKFPTMFFIVEGNETEFLIEYASQLQPTKPIPKPTTKG